MKATSVWSAVLVLGVLMSSACGEAPTTPQTELQPSAAGALICDGSTTTPVITLNGPEYTQVECFLPRHEPGVGDPYVDPGASAADQCYGDLSSQIIALGQVNQQVPGVYTLEYQVQDLAGNWADPAVRTVEVIDSLAPVVTADASIPLTPVDGTMRTLELSECAEVIDLCEGYMPISINAGITSITSDEPGQDVGDILFEEGGSTFALRAEANAWGDGRQYTVHFVAYDSTGNSSPGECTFVVPAGQ